MSEIFTIPANGRIPVGFPARYIFVESVSVAGAEFDIEGYGEYLGDQFDFAETMSEGAGLNGFPVPVNDWYLINKNAFALTVTLKAGIVYYEKNELVGDVNSLTRPDDRTVDGDKFWSGNVLQADLGNSQIMLWNPAGSGVNVVLSAVRVLSASGAVTINRTTVTTDYIEVNNFVAGAGGSNKVISDLVLPKAGIWQKNNSTVRGVAMAQAPTAQTGAPTKLNFMSEPIHIPAGYGLEFVNQTDNSLLAVYLEWSEQ